MSASVSVRACVCACACTRVPSDESVSPGDTVPQSRDVEHLHPSTPLRDGSEEGCRAHAQWGPVGGRDVKSWETPTDTEMTPRIKQVSRSGVLIDASANKV